MADIQGFLGYYGPVLVGYALRLLALLAGVLIVSLSPLGRMLIQFLRERRGERAINEAVLAELEQLRATLGELAERLDSTERLLSIRNEPSLAPGHAEPEQRAQDDTPH